MHTFNTEEPNRKGREETSRRWRDLWSDTQDFFEAVLVSTSKWTVCLVLASQFHLWWQSIQRSSVDSDQCRYTVCVLPESCWNVKIKWFDLKVITKKHIAAMKEHEVHGSMPGIICCCTFPNRFKWCCHQWGSVGLWHHCTLGQWDQACNINH